MLKYTLRALPLLLLSAVTFAQSAPTPTDSEGHPWWHHAVFYEVYPRSYMDANNDGIGDLNGIASKMDYLHWLGVDAIWITPCFPSPQVDFGYDVSNYVDIDPMYGTLKDFDRMETRGKKNGVSIVLDLVVNHTSDKHKWFLQSESSKANAYRDWYIWRDGKAPNQVPNNWTSIFGGSAWQWSAKTGQYYYHFFYPQQPDLNWRNPKVENAIFDVTRFWYKRGVVGFRLDAVDTLFEDPNLTNNPSLPGKDAYGEPNQEHTYNTNLPEVMDALAGLRKVANQYNAVLIGETWTDTIEKLKSYYGPQHDRIQMPMDLAFTKLTPLSPSVFRQHIAAVIGSGEWPVWVMSNHDIVRAYTRFADGKHNDAIAKLLAGMYLTLPGTPVLYYGEEIGMENNDPTRREDVKDPIGRLGWPEQKGRDGERTPMQWNATPNAGFTTGIPWLPIPTSYQTHNVASEQQDPGSILNFYRRLISLRKTNPALLEGDWVALNPDDQNVLSYLRRNKDEAVIVVLNMSENPQKMSFELAQQGFPAPDVQTLLSTMSSSVTQKLSSFELEPFAVYIGEVTKK